MGAEGFQRKPKSSLDEALQKFAEDRKENPRVTSESFPAGEGWGGYYNPKTFEVTLVRGEVTSRSIIEGGEIKTIETFNPSGFSLEDDTHSKQLHRGHLQKLIAEGHFHQRENRSIVAE